ncbi:MAG: Stp1/IreP family PP2C-type Ser/Thr phosphatase [Lachnospiraceae bacterium]|nr:Stp1/IreP family PP2C-type Ser/Thr phosphatase [Lachnospiraceae bacterium]
MTAYGMKDVGQVRSINQDYFFISESPVGNLPNLFMVADGMGGHKAGDLASEYTVTMVREAVSKSMQTNPFQILKGAVQYANQKLREKAEESLEYAGMGTTLVIATVDEEKQTAYVVNIGDSRLYKVGDSIEQVTQDHSLVEEMVRLGELSREEARNHPDRNIITRAVGVSERVEPDYFDTSLGEGECLLLCSDGLTSMLEDAEIEGIMKGQSTPKKKAQKLILAANKNGGKDNIAVIVIEQEKMR